MLKEVRLSSDVYAVCVAHAISTEKDEVIGLLIGDIVCGISYISASVVLQRSDKRCNRVEISPEQLSAASQYSEELTCKLKRPMRVTGWYHSHPHITVWPSHVDVETQRSYQLMEKDFVGLIFSFFNHDKSACSPSEKMMMTCFQAGEEEQQRIDVPVVVVPSPYITSPILDTLASLPSILWEEEEGAFLKANSNKDGDHLTAVINETAHTRALCGITEIVNVPLIEMLEQRQIYNDGAIKKLKDEREILKKRLAALEAMEEEESCD